MKFKNIAVIGATGNVGRKVIELLLQRGLVEPGQLHLLASSQSVGKTLDLEGHSFQVADTQKATLLDNDLCIFNTESDVSLKWIPQALEAGAYVIDSSSAYRLNPEVPLIIPPVNKHEIRSSQKLYSHANCLASPIATVLGPLHKEKKIKRVNLVSYQSTSGAGKKAMDDCWLETQHLIESRPYERQHFKRQIAFNVIPQVGDIREDGLTFEEYKIIHEVKKVVDPEIAITATAVRVPVMVGHSIALSVEFFDAFDLQMIHQLLKASPSIQVNNSGYATPIDVVGSDDVFVGRIRRDPSIENGLQLWLCSDNLRRGAAADVVEIVDALMQCLPSESH